MLRNICITLAAACIAASSAAEEPSRFVGNWAGEWDHKKGERQLNELNIRAVDAEGRITALYCFERATGPDRSSKSSPVESNRPSTGRCCASSTRGEVQVHPHRRRHAATAPVTQGQGVEDDDVTPGAVGLCRLDQATNAGVDGAAYCWSTTSLAKPTSSSSGARLSREPSGSSACCNGLGPECPNATTPTRASSWPSRWAASPSSRR